MSLEDARNTLVMAYYSCLLEDEEFFQTVR